MDQRKIGQFIAEMRKEHGLTQRELADKLMISDKTVSKWERGNGLPEVSLMMPLCDVLQISVNELLSGTRLLSSEYKKNAEENIMRLMNETQRAKRSLWLGILAVVVTFLAGLTLIMLSGFLEMENWMRIVLIVIGFVTLEPWDMPGYDSKVIMAAGCFVEGSSVELSADAPVKEPYTAYFQGGLTYEHCKYALKKILARLL